LTENFVDSYKLHVLCPSAVAATNETERWSITYVSCTT